MRLKGHNEVLSATGPPSHTELAGCGLGKVPSIMWDQKDTGSLKGETVNVFLDGWLYFSSSMVMVINIQLIKMEFGCS